MLGDLSGALVPPLQLWPPPVEVGAAADPVRDVEAGTEPEPLLPPALALSLGLLLGLPLGPPPGLPLGIPLGLPLGLPLGRPLGPDWISLCDDNEDDENEDVNDVIVAVPVPLAPVGLPPPVAEGAPLAIGVVVAGAGDPEPKDGAAEHVLTDRPTVNDASPAASRGSDLPSGRVPT